MIFVYRVMSLLYPLQLMGAPYGILGGPWPTQTFLWVGHNAFGPPKNFRAKYSILIVFNACVIFFINFRLDSIVRLIVTFVSIMPADCGITEWKIQYAVITSF
jgi:hypothetical protein